MGFATFKFCACLSSCDPFSCRDYRRHHVISPDIMWFPPSPSYFCPLRSLLIVASSGDTEQCNCVCSWHAEIPSDGKSLLQCLGFRVVTFWALLFKSTTPHMRVFLLIPCRLNSLIFQIKGTRSLDVGSKIVSNWESNTRIPFNHFLYFYIYRHASLNDEDTFFEMRR